MIEAMHHSTYPGWFEDVGDGDEGVERRVQVFDKYLDADLAERVCGDDYASLK